MIDGEGEGARTEDIPARTATAWSEGGVVRVCHHAPTKQATPTVPTAAAAMRKRRGRFVSDGNTGRGGMGGTVPMDGLEGCDVLSYAMVGIEGCDGGG